MPPCEACLKDGTREMALAMTIFLAQQGSNYYNAILSAEYSQRNLPLAVFEYYRINSIVRVVCMKLQFIKHEVLS